MRFRDIEFSEEDRWKNKILPYKEKSWAEVEKHILESFDTDYKPVIDVEYLTLQAYEARLDYFERGE